MSCLDVAWHQQNTQPTGLKVVCSAADARNAFGLCDLSGNAWEWVWDRASEDFFGAASTDPVGPSHGSERLVKGGAWSTDAWLVRAATRSALPPDSRGANIGFRLVRSASDP